MENENRRKTQRRQGERRKNDRRIGNERRKRELLLKKGEVDIEKGIKVRSEERRGGKECRSRW